MSRLPTVSGDANAWGSILNDFLSVAHNSNGSLKNLFINVKDPAYGAKGDGITDDTAAINSAITAAASGGIIFFPFGTYIISSSLIIDNDNIALVGQGQRGSAATIQVAATSDPTYALVVGNTRNANSCLISGISFVGRNSTSSTGKGIRFRSNGGKMYQVKVALFGGNGIDLDSFSGTIYEVFLEDVEITTNGMNSSTHGDGLTISGLVSDSEYHRVICSGDVGKTTTVNGIKLVSAGAQKFVDCHCYFCSNDGLNNAASPGAKLSIIGGAYETNGVNGIETAGPGASIVGSACYSNGNTGIACYAQTSVADCTLNANTNADIYVNSANGGVLAGNICSGTISAISLDTGAAGYVVADNNLAATTTNVLTTKSTNSDIHDNTITGGGNIVEQTGAQGNNIHDNTLIGGGSITIIGTTTRVRNNPGYNPVGQVTAPGFPATTVGVTNTSGRDVTAYIANGTAAITVIQIAGVAGTYVTTGMQIAASGWGSVRLPVGASVKFTFASGAPSWTWMAD